MSICISNLLYSLCAMRKITNVASFPKKQNSVHVQYSTNSVLFELALHQYGLFWLKDDKRNVSKCNICNNICMVKVRISRLSHLDSQLSIDFSYSEVNVMGQWWKKERASIICDFLTKLQYAVLSLVTQIATYASHSGMPSLWVGLSRRMHEIKSLSPLSSHF